MLEVGSEEGDAEEAIVIVHTLERLSKTERRCDGSRVFRLGSVQVASCAEHYIMIMRIEREKPDMLDKYD